MKILSDQQRRLTLEAVVSVMWTKNEVADFLLECNVPMQMIDQARTDTRDNSTKRKILGSVFEQLNAQPDRGTSQFRLMTDRLCQWATFNPRWFDIDPHLNREDAHKAINALRLSLGLEERTAHGDSSKKTQAESPTSGIAAFKERYLDLTKKTLEPNSAQKRGFELERLLNDLFNESGFTTIKSFKVRGMQIDGSFKHEGQHYLVEAKWTHNSESSEPVFVFSQKVESNMYGRGLFLSINGFTDTALLTLVHARVKNVVLMDGNELFSVLDERLSLVNCLESKIQAAQVRGDIYYDPLTMRSKIDINVKNTI